MFCKDVIILYYTILYYTILYYISEGRVFEFWQQQTKLVKIESDSSTTPRSATDALQDEVTR